MLRTGCIRTVAYLENEGGEWEVITQDEDWNEYTIMKGEIQTIVSLVDGRLHLDDKILLKRDEEDPYKFSFEVG